MRYLFTFYSIGEACFPIGEASVHAIRLLEALIAKIGGCRLTHIAVIAVDQQGLRGIGVFDKRLHSSAIDV